MSRMIQDEGRHCATICQCGMCGKPVRLVHADSGQAFAVKAGEFNLLRLVIMPVEMHGKPTPRSEAVRLEHWNGTLPMTTSKPLSPEEAVQFVRGLGLPDEFFRHALAEYDWINLPACVECGGPAEHRLRCGHPICSECYETYQPECVSCNGYASWCTLAVETPDTSPMYSGPDVAPDEHLEAVYEERTEVQQ